MENRAGYEQTNLEAVLGGGEQQVLRAAGGTVWNERRPRSLEIWSSPTCDWHSRVVGEPGASGPQPGPGQILQTTVTDWCMGF